MNQIDEIAHLIQLSVAPVFLLTGIATLLNVLSGRLARIIDRARVLEQRLDTPNPAHVEPIGNELCVLERRGRLIYHAIKLSTTSALLVCFLIAVLFASSIFHHSTRLIISGLFIAAMLASILSLTLFLREVYFAIETFEISLPQPREKTTGRSPQAIGKQQVLIDTADASRPKNLNV
jgi:phosphoglycerol transferase MdoB-like AlkP superfamily enzyme